MNTGSVQKQGIALTTILLIALAVHFPLMLMELPINSYDANYHIFFAAHYAHHWFNPWNEKWYAGFSQTMYPPLPHQWIALFSHVLGLTLAYMLVQLIAILLLVVGTYRFSRLWVDERSASYAALGSIFIGSLSFLVYQAGQLSHTMAAPLYLNALPYLYYWIRRGSVKSLLKGVVLGSAAAAAHHVTLIFGSILFAIPVVWLAILDRDEDDQKTSVATTLVRTAVFAVAAGIAVLVVLWPFFRVLLHNPVQQVPIPHQSRLNYLLNPIWGMNYQVIPYGALLLALPYIFYKGASQRRLRPLFFGFWLTFILALGGTTPFPKWFLGRAFEILTFERFTLWACMMALPIVGLGASTLIDRFDRKAVIALWAAAVGTCGLAVAWTTFHPISTENSLNVDPVIAFINRENHSQYRYLCLGFGQQLSKVNTYANASTVDGDYNSARLLPELTRSGAAQLNSAKYFGSAGMEALRSMLKHADNYGLRFIFVRDQWYEPLLAFAGWHKIESYNNGAIGLWSKDDVPPAKPVIIDPKAMPTRMEGIWWGLAPIGSSFLALLLILLLPEALAIKVREPQSEPASVEGQKGISGPRRLIPSTVFALITLFAIALGTAHAGASSPASTPERALQSFFEQIKSRDYDAAYAQLGNKSSINKAAFTADISGDNEDLLNYATLESVDTQTLRKNDREAVLRAALQWSTSVGPIHETRDIKLVREADAWRVNWPELKEQRVPPQVIPTTFLRWDVFHRGPADDWGTQDVDAPRVRIIAMNVAEYEGSVIVLGELENEDTVPAFVSVGATLLGDQGRVLGNESSFDKINHVLLPKGISPFRIDFPGVPIKLVQDVRMQTNAALISAAADPAIAVVHQALAQNSSGQRILKGELVNQGSKIVNIPHVIVTCYNSAGKLVWVTDAYVPHALLPNIAQPFSVEMRNDLPNNVDNYRVTVNYYIINRV